MRIDFIKSSEKRRIVEALNQQFGIESLPYLLIQSGKEKLRAYSGHLSKDEILSLSEIAYIDSIGIYLIRMEFSARLSFDATHLLASQLKKNIIEINESQAKEWLRGFDLGIQKPSGTYIVKFENDFLGCGKSNGEKIINHVPKERRLRR